MLVESKFKRSYLKSRRIAAYIGETAAKILIVLHPSSPSPRLSVFLPVFPVPRRATTDIRSSPRTSRSRVFLLLVVFFPPAPTNKTSPFAVASRKNFFRSEPTNYRTSNRGKFSQGCGTRRGQRIHVISTFLKLGHRAGILFPNVQTGFPYLAGFTLSVQPAAG